MSLLAVRTELATILGGIADIKQIYYEAPTNVAVTPGAVLMVSSGLDEMSSTCENSMDSTYTVRLIVEKTDDNDNGKAQTDVLLGLMDQVLDAIRLKTNTTLNGESYYLLPEWGEISAADGGNFPVYYADILIKVKTLKSIN